MGLAVIASGFIPGLVSIPVVKSVRVLFVYCGVFLWEFHFAASPFYDYFHDYFFDYFFVLCFNGYLFFLLFS